MSAIPVYAIINLIINDVPTYRPCEKGFFPILKKYGGEFVTFDDETSTLEGLSPRTGRKIIFKFPSEPQALRWHADPEYQALSEHRLAGTRLGFLTIVRGLPQR